VGNEVSGGGFRQARWLAVVSLVAAAILTGVSSGALTGARQDGYAVTSSIRPGDRLSGAVAWVATPSDAGATARVEFLIDGRLAWTEDAEPFEFNGSPGGRLDTRALGNGRHTLEARAVTAQGGVARVIVPVSVANEAPAPGLFVGDFETGDLSQWSYLGDAHGATVVRAPTFSRASRFALRCDTTNAPDSSVSGDGCIVQPDSFDLPWANDGGDAWFRTQMLFPSGAKPAYPGTFTLSPPGGWNVVMQWHNSRCDACPPSYLSPTVAVGRDPKGRAALRFRMVGGDAMRPTYTYVVHPARLVRDRWYDVVVHIRWSPDPTRGLAEWFVDGRRLFSRSLATLFRLPDGTTSKAVFGVGHYRLTAGWTDTVYVDGVTVGARPPAVAKTTEKNVCFLDPPLQRFWIRCERGRKPS
jgi:hypothetical protein